MRTRFYAAYNNNDEILKDSSSGGIFWLLVELIIANNGVVYGAVAEHHFNILHKRGENIEQCKAFRKSKYLQSDMGNCYKEAWKDLKEGRTVLFSGTPCQIAGLYSFLGKTYDNLITCDVVCHGVPSNTAFKKWLEDLSVEHESHPVSMIWRDKRKGWGPNYISYKFENQKEWCVTSQNNLFQKGFLDNLYLRPSCYSCRYASLPRIADISLADFWGYKGSLSIPNQNKGLSIVIASTEKGKSLFESFKNRILYEEVSEDFVKMCSRHVWKHPKRNPFRSFFFKRLKNESFTRSATHYLYPSLWLRTFRKFALIINKDLYD